MDRIASEDEGVIVARKKSTSPISIEWANPDRKYKGSYVVVLRDAFNNGFIDILETEVESISFDPRKYGHRYILYFVKAEDCRASRTYKIEVKP